MTPKFTIRIANGVKQALSLEGIVGVLIGAGVLAVAAAIVTQLTEFSIGASSVLEPRS